MSHTARTAGQKQAKILQCKRISSTRSAVPAPLIPLSSSPTNFVISLSSLHHFLVLIRWTSNMPYGHTLLTLAHTHVGVWRAVFANDEGVCIPAPLLLRRLETLRQINRQHGPAITIAVFSSPPCISPFSHQRSSLPHLP